MVRTIVPRRLASLPALTLFSVMLAGSSSIALSSTAQAAEAKAKTTSQAQTAADAPSAGASVAAPAAATGTAGVGTNIFFVDGGIRSDLGTYVSKDIVGRATINDQTMDAKAFGPMLHLGYLAALSDHFRLGGAFGYGFNYTVVERLEKGSNADPDRFRMGQLITADLRLEWYQHLAGPVFLSVMPLAGITMIAAGGDLKSATQAVEESHNVWKGPRLGFIAGADAGVRYMVKDWLSLKLGGGWGYTLQSLLHATRKGDAADSKRVWRVAASRINATFALEAHF